MALNTTSLRAMPDLVREVRRRPAEAADPDRAPGMQAYMKSTMPFYGVSSVSLRRICRSVYDAHLLGSRTEWEALKHVG